MHMSSSQIKEPSVNPTHATNARFGEVKKTLLLHFLPPESFFSAVIFSIKSKYAPVEIFFTTDVTSNLFVDRIRQGLSTGAS